MPAYANGHLVGPLRSGYRNITIPEVVMPAGFEDFARCVYLRQAISALETVALEPETAGDVNFPWPGDLVALTQREGRLNRRLVLCGAWQTVARAQFVGLIDTVAHFLPTGEIPFDRLLRAEAFRALGRDEEAARWYDSLTDGYEAWSTPQAAVILLGRGLSLARLGRSTAAARNLRAALNLLRPNSVPESVIQQAESVLAPLEAGGNASTTSTPSHRR